MPFFSTKLLEPLFSPLGAIYLMLFVSIFAQLGSRARLAFVSKQTALSLLWLTSTPMISAALTRPLEMRSVSSVPITKADAIVVLGGVTQPALSPQPLVHLTRGADRLLYAAALYKAGTAPLVVLSGGRLPWLAEKRWTESAEMAEVLLMMGVPRQSMLEESSSRDTFENARNVRNILRLHSIRRVLLVTSAVHMPRALAAFKRQGIDATPAPTDFTTSLESYGGPSDHLEAMMLGLVPDLQGLEESSVAIHEWLALLMYRLTGRI
jgi:uncharacterized SAM-binding protein YcdF (DUF218 family)